MAPPPNSYDACVCAHPYSYHDPTTNLCRFYNDLRNSCGCAGFSIPGQNQTPLVSDETVNTGDGNT